jgi:UDP-N-acetylenolpyruvoylglucosamine reductase
LRLKDKACAWVNQVGFSWEPSLTSDLQKQALVLVNYGGGNGNDIRELAATVQDSVDAKYGIRLSPEVNFV